MVHKNLRTLLYYVVGVTAVCLMIEVTTASKEFILWTDSLVTGISL